MPPPTGDCLHQRFCQLIIIVVVVVVCSYVFWFGDLNFRMDELLAAEVKSRVSAGDLESLWNYDQVSARVTIIFHFLWTKVHNVISS